MANLAKGNGYVYTIGCTNKNQGIMSFPQALAVALLPLTDLPLSFGELTLA